MKRIFIGMAAVALLFTACSDDQEDLIQEEQTEIDMSDFYVYTETNSENQPTFGVSNSQSNLKSCSSMSNLNRLLNENPGLEQKMFNIERNARKFIASKKPAGAGNGGGGNGGGGDNPPPPPVDDGLGIINIPVYIHIVYSNNNENISDTQVNSQMTVLNADFRKTNDTSQLPTEFAGLAADSEFTFSLAGTFRHSNSRTSWGTNDAVKGAYPPVTPETHLNIWVANIGGGILGYAQFPGGPFATDGIVVSPQYFGTTGFVSAPFDEGRTMTHEIGHYLNLRHIWGDGRCRQDDFVADTPSSDAPNYGCPSYPTVNCRSNDMTMNYMDYTDDACMALFSEGQKSRMRAIFAPGGARESMLQ